MSKECHQKYCQVNKCRVKKCHVKQCRVKKCHDKKCHETLTSRSQLIGLITSHLIINVWPLIVTSGNIVISGTEKKRKNSQEQLVILRDDILSDLVCGLNSVMEKSGRIENEPHSQSITEYSIVG